MEFFFYLNKKVLQMDFFSIQTKKCYNYIFIFLFFVSKSTNYIKKNLNILLLI
jgi:hypothetical protein